MMMHDFHGQKTMNLHRVADIADVAVAGIIQCFLLNVTFETCSETYLKTENIEDRNLSWGNLSLSKIIGGGEPPPTAASFS